MRFADVRRQAALLLALFAQLGHVTDAQLYAPFFNAALRRPVTSYPADVACGESGAEKFCDSASDEQSTRTCSEETCTSSCPHGDSWPNYQTVAGKYDSERFALGECVRDERSFAAPTVLGARDCLRFTGEGTECSMPLQKEWLAPIVFLNRIWRTSFTFWIYNELENKRGTILDAFYDRSSTDSVLRFVLEREKLSVVSGRTTLTSDTWKVPRDQWTHVGIQLNNKTISVFINGQHAVPAYYNVTLRENNNAVNWWIGNSHDYNPFVGYLQDFRIYFDVLVNRGINSVYNNGTLTQTRIYPSCHCPRDFPRLREDEQTYCIQNSGNGSTAREMFRLNRFAHPLEYVNDDHIDKSWITETPLEEVSVEIDLGDVYEVHHVIIKLFSPVPGLIKIERQPNNSDVWLPWQYFSENCRSQVGVDTNGPLINPDDVICKEIINFDSKFIYSGAEVVLDLLQGRPGMINGSMSTALRHFLLARAIRVTLKGHPFVTDDRQKYHGISEIKVNATCNCNGHGSDCHLNKHPYQCVCAPSSFTSGTQCDVCVGNTYEITDPDTGTMLQCKPCDCNTDGTVAGNDTCQVDGGQCNCKPLVIGRSCSACLDGYFNLTASNPGGCEPCNCNTSGTVNGSDLCDPVTGQCVCKENVEGLKCDSCKPGYFGFSANHTAGCLGCSCDERGTLPGNNSCDIFTATCLCKKYATGHSCDQCQAGAYNLSFDNPQGCQLCQCNTSFGAVNTSCDATSGLCYCRDHVTGSQCDSCEKGYYGRDVAEIVANGCSRRCNCDPIGSEPYTTDLCAWVGGQCRCKPGVTGRRCDRCSPGGYAFGTSNTEVCLPCNCDVRGTQNESIACNDTGDCYCMPNVTGSKCDACAPGYFNLSADHVGGCLSCDCFVRGTVAGKVCDPEHGKCDCLPGEGDPELGGRTCMAYVSSIIPDYGPLAGGTNITMTTGYLGDVTSVYVYLGDHECQVDKAGSNQTLLNCTSPKVPLESRDLNKPQLVKITWTGSRDRAKGQVKFTYRDDPVIESITPLKTIVSGGLYLTVTGQHLDSVMFPYMTVTMVKRSKGIEVARKMFTTRCQVQTSHRMICLTPNLTSPETATARRKRDVILDTIRHEHVHRRQRRQATVQNQDPDAVGDADMTFYLGFILDGVQSYRNMSIQNPQIGILRVFKNPEFNMFPEADHIKPYRLFWPLKDNHILISGRYLNYGCTMADYWIQIGSKNCTKRELYDSALLCVPPEVEPVAARSDNGIAPDQPQVVVHIGNIHHLVGYLDYQTSFWDYEILRYGIIAAAAVILLILIILITCCILRSRGKKRSGIDKNRPRSYISAYETKDDGLKPYETIPDPDVMTLMPGDLRVAILDLIVDRDRLSVGKVIGEGHFGKVHVGFLTTDSQPNPELVAVKTLKDTPNRSSQDTIQFLEEATMMKDFRHNNVLSVLGVVIDSDNVQVILPYMENGDLKSFINREDNMLTVGELIHFGLQIATGMCYLSEQRFVHRDLACRNCMVNKNLIVKVADFGLARDIYEQDYYRVGPKKRPLPVKWMAIESLDSGVWTTKSDVWSYGVVLWELLTRGCTPYPDVDGYDMKAYLMAGHRMVRPDYAPDETYSLMLDCWQKDPDLRPTFREIMDRMSYFLNEVSARTFMRDKHGQQVPSIANRKHKYLQLIG